jgi:hypothetical protein
MAGLGSRSISLVFFSVLTQAVSALAFSLALLPLWGLGVLGLGNTMALGLCLG